MDKDRSVFLNPTIGGSMGKKRRLSKQVLSGVPVITNAGRTYDLLEIAEYLSHSSNDPITSEPIQCLILDRSARLDESIDHDMGIKITRCLKAIARAHPTIDLFFDIKNSPNGPLIVAPPKKIPTRKTPIAPVHHTKKTSDFNPKLHFFSAAQCWPKGVASVLCGALISNAISERTNRYNSIDAVTTSIVGGTFALGTIGFLAVLYEMYLRPEHSIPCETLKTDSLDEVIHYQLKIVWPILSCVLYAFVAKLEHPTLRQYAFAYIAGQPIIHSLMMLTDYLTLQFKMSNLGSKYQCPIAWSACKMPVTIDSGHTFEFTEIARSLLAQGKNSNPFAPDSPIRCMILNHGLWDKGIDFTVREQEDILFLFERLKAVFPEIEQHGFFSLPFIKHASEIKTKISQSELRPNDMKLLICSMIIMIAYHSSFQYFSTLTSAFMRRALGYQHDVDISNEIQSVSLYGGMIASSVLCLGVLGLLGQERFRGDGEDKRARAAVLIRVSMPITR